jgi:hypothetical protein
MNDDENNMVNQMVDNTPEKIYLSVKILIWQSDGRGAHYAVQSGDNLNVSKMIWVDLTCQLSPRHKIQHEK